MNSNALGEFYRLYVSGLVWLKYGLIRCQGILASRLYVILMCCFIEILAAKKKLIKLIVITIKKELH